VQMANDRGRPVAPNDVMFTVGKLSRMSRREGDLSFDSDIGKIQSEGESAIFDMGIEDAKKLVEFSKDLDAGGAKFSLLKELEVQRGSNFGKQFDDRRGGRFSRDRRGGGGGGGGGSNYRGNNNSSSNYGRSNGGQSRGGYRGQSNSYARSGSDNRGGQRDNRRQEGGQRDNRRQEGGQQGQRENRGRYDSRRQNNDEW
jgi:hypothetical protein